MRLVREIYLGDRLVGQLVFQTTNVEAHAQLSTLTSLETVMTIASGAFSNGLETVLELRRPDSDGSPD